MLAKKAIYKEELNLRNLYVSVKESTLVKLKDYNRTSIQAFQKLLLSKFNFPANGIKLGKNKKEASYTKQHLYNC